ncbi:WYL domain-containing protein [Paenibacillus sp. UMB4589-SE434]|uniref:WYL domain-containing protein n=1 Tax=Paenibacillus sp. UMB4589-SE434 TaxID=3046314 RepID=UPI00254D7509|nr:WYL domain-containing protein [Paenibacillus sp. UMB4589-SE434]MDK8182041.1 WYL domain-containing protein [Paenibacillus sp. UMB4589-SE434]
MNLFEKIFNYQVLSRLEDSGTFMITSHERAWLKMMLDHPAAVEAFTAETLDKLCSLLEQDQRMDTRDHLLEKAKSTEGQVYHSLLRSLRRHITNKSGICLTYQLKRGQVQSEQSGLPYKLEYSMVKREWYLLWYHLRHRAFMSTRLKNIITVSAEPIPPEKAERILAHVARTLDSRKTDVVIEIVREYNQELSRILYAFSCFEKDVAYDEEQDTYRVRVCLPGDEMEFLLSKIRFLGKRVRVIEGSYLKRRMLEASTKALERYGVEHT